MQQDLLLRHLDLLGPLKREARFRAALIELLPRAGCFRLTELCTFTALDSARAAVSAGTLSQGFSGDAMFPDVELEKEILQATS